ncbi:MAG TPA: hypothetical protein VFY90_02750, partial [Tepidiformaceae bacterium]|nr:hypothetical protein [Tepidiformaceae bacterium]
MSKFTAIQWLFIVSAIFDGVLGLAFLFAGSRIFDWFDVTAPNHWGYVQFGAAILVVFAIMFAQIARDPAANRAFIPYAVLFKLSYAGVVAYHWAGL